MPDHDQREPIVIPDGARIFGLGNDGYAEFERAGETVRVRVTFSRDREGGYRVFNTDELVEPVIGLLTSE